MVAPPLFIKRRSFVIGLVFRPIGSFTLLFYTSVKVFLRPIFEFFVKTC